MNLIRYSGHYSVRNTLVEPPSSTDSDLFIAFASPGEITSVFRDDESGEWVAFRLQAVFDFEAVGILKSLLDPLAAAGIPILAFSSYLTDHVLVKRSEEARAVEAWR